MSFFGFEDKSFYRQIFRIAIPMILQSAMTSMLTMVDNIMVGMLSDSALAALSHANQVSFLLFVFVFGITSASTTFTSQYWGKQDLKSIRRTLGMALSCCVVIGVTFFAVAQLFAGNILSMFTKDPEVYQLGVDYLRIVSFIYPMQTITLAYASVLRGTEHVRLPTISSIIGVCTNAVLNYILIFGKLGFPAMGVKGAAIATAIGQAVDMTIVLLFSYLGKMPTANRQYKMFPIKGSFARRYAKVAFPVFINESLWSLAQVATMLIYAQLGTQMAAAMGIFNVVDRIGYTVFVGLSNSCLVLVGKQIGMGDEETAYVYARRFLRLTPLIAIGMGLFINLASPLLLGFYNISDVAMQIVRNTILIYGLNMPFAMLNNTMVVGVLRGGGDTRFSLFVDSGMHWCVTVTCVFIGALVLKIPPMWVYACVVPGDIVKNIIGLKRFVSRKWIHNLTT